jgi:signal transduction histidine kinase/CheY-like chemotaxis protein/HPt (histidine-containing phosphotransfer) domain-containing protein
MMPIPLEQEKFKDSVQILTIITTKMAVPLFLLFWVLDILYVPQLKWEFLAIRSSIIPTVIITHWWLQQATSHRQTEQAGLFLIFMCAAILNAMIYRIGSGALYVTLLQLVAIGGLSFIPWSRRYFIAALLAVYVPYYTIELTRIHTKEDINQLLTNSFFVIGVVTISWIILYYREQLRHRELVIRNDLEKEVASHQQTEQQLIAARDEALAATRAKDTFLANMSHEIRTPLTAIIGFAEQAMDKDTSAEQRETSLGIIVSSSHHLLNIINDILDFSKIEANSIEIEQLAMDPYQLTCEAQALVTPLADKKGLVLQIACEFPIPSLITSDPVRLKQILINLCSNAIKFTEKGAITITLAFDALDKAMIFRVQDSGIGMTPEQLARIFEPFKQADTSITRRYGGTGLGLSLSRRLAELLGGTLTVTSLPHVGSEFLLRVDAGILKDVAMLERVEQFSERESTEPVHLETLLTGKVLVADDTVLNQQLFSLCLTKMGVHVSIAENGAIALQQARAHHYDLILMDMQMPVLSGVDAVRQLRQLGYTLPIVALTANATKEDRRQCLESGCNDFLTKPITRSRLYNMVSHYLAPAQATLGDIEPVEPLHSMLIKEDPEYAEVVTIFVNNLPIMVAAIRGAQQTNDWGKVRTIVHDLKGMGGGFGYPQLTEHAEVMETLLNRGNYAALEQAIRTLSTFADSIEAGMPRPRAKDGDRQARGTR